MILTNNPAKTIWLTGLSGSGKTTLSKELQQYFILNNLNLIRLDGDELRSGLNSDLGFSKEDRTENIRRVAHVSKVLNTQGVWTIVALITPLNTQRKLARNIVGENFISVYVNCPLEVCEQRDVKGLYKEARSGMLKNFTGISHGFEIPNDSDLMIDTDKFDVQNSVNQIIEFLKNG
jgi:adenylyl-sulfate kinase